jgi:hypothetical protein
MHLCKGNGLRPSHSGTCRLEMSANHVQFALHAAPYFMMRNRSVCLTKFSRADVFCGWLPRCKG